MVDGQKLDGDLAIPPRKEANGQAEKPDSEGDLIDVGGDEAPAQTPAQTTQTPAVKTPTEIETMLNSTGKPAEGPLLDFADDMKKDLPATEGEP